jgi:hypothetical protein
MTPTPSELTEERLAAIKARAEAATPGPWTTEQVQNTDWDFARAEAAFVAHAREDIPWLLAQLATPPRDHADETCSECGGIFCATVMHETPDSVGAHSEDIGWRSVCPYCWMRPTPPRDEPSDALDSETIEQAQELVAMLTCPHYTQTGNKQCVSGRRDEPACQTGGPWLDQIVEVLTVVADAGAVTPPPTRGESDG